MQCAKHNVGHISISCIFIQMCTYMASNIRNFNSFHTIMYQVGSHLHIVNMENSFCLSFQKNGFKELDFLCIKLLANFFHPPYITEEISTQCSVSIDHLFYRVQPVYIISNNFSSGEIFFSATRFIISDRISNSDSTTAK